MCIVRRSYNVIQLLKWSFFCLKCSRVEPCLIKTGWCHKHTPLPPHMPSLTSQYAIVRIWQSLHTDVYYSKAGSEFLLLLKTKNSTGFHIQDEDTPPPTPMVSIWSSRILPLDFGLVKWRQKYLAPIVSNF
jgi:hypothetical protein